MHRGEFNAKVSSTPWCKST